MMMKNEYDNEALFAQDARMPRSQGGLEAAGEWRQLKKLFPPLKDQTVLDLGCGYGWHCRYALEQGASRVLGIDLSEKMLAKARELGEAPNLSYRLCDLEGYEYPEEAWDCVVSNLALHYIEALEDLFRKVHRTLTSGGVFLFNMEHPVFTARQGQDWIYDEESKPLYWPVDDYFRPGRRTTHFLGCKVEKYHHTLTQILMGLLRSGFTLEAVEEAEPPEEMLSLPGMDDELRRPMMLLVKARAKK